MYTITVNKNFIFMFFKKKKDKLIKLSPLFLQSTSFEAIYSILKNKPLNKYYVSKIYICKFTNWIFVYIFIYSITNLRAKTSLRTKKNKNIKYFNKQTLYQNYLASRNKFLYNGRNK
jgi:hypothetical protein